MTTFDILTPTDEGKGGCNTQDSGVFLCYRLLFPSNLPESTALFLESFRGRMVTNCICYLWDIRCPGNFQQETPSTPSQIKSRFLCCKEIIINLHYNGTCQSKGILLKEKRLSCYPQTPLTFYRNHHFQSVWLASSIVSWWN